MTLEAKNWVPAFAGMSGWRRSVHVALRLQAAGMVRHDTMADAIAREKQIKAGSRRKKLALIEAMNPAWRDLYENIV